MKKTIIILMAALLLLAGCASIKVEGQPDAEGTVTVGWYDGSKLLREDRVEKGTKLTSWTPVKEGSTFMAWYGEASKTILFDFDTPVEEDTDLFAGFKGGFVEDTNTWCLIGSGAGTLKGSNWSESADTEENFKLTKSDDKGANIYRIEGVVLYEGDAFQIRVMGTWTNQHGVGYLEGYTACSDGDIVGEVVVDGERWFYANGGFGEQATGWNVNVQKSGIYTLTLETNPGSSAYDVIRFERTGDAPTIDITHRMYVVGTPFEWNATDEGEMATDALREDFSLTVNITEEALADWTADEKGTIYAAVKVLNDVNGTWYGVSGEDFSAESWTLTPSGQDNLLLQPGQYNVTYCVTNDSAVISKSEKGYFLAGVVNGADYWNCRSGITFEATDDPDTYVSYYTFTEADTASWIADGGKKGAFKAVQGYSGCDADLWFGTENGDNYMVDDYGLYEITLHLTADGGYVTAEKLEGLFLVGTLKDGDTWRAESAFRMDGSSITYTFTQKDSNTWCAPDFAAVKIIDVDTLGNVTWYGAADGGNVMIPKAGTYTITLSGGIVTVK